MGTERTGVMKVPDLVKKVSPALSNSISQSPLSCPGASYLLMGQLEESKGPILPPESFVVPYKPNQDQILNNLSKRKCPSLPRLAA